MEDCHINHTTCFREGKAKRREGREERERKGEGYREREERVPEGKKSQGRGEAEGERRGNGRGRDGRERDEGDAFSNILPGGIPVGKSPLIFNFCSPSCGQDSR